MAGETIQFPKAENLSAELALLSEILHAEKEGVPIPNYHSLVRRMGKYGMSAGTVSKAQDVLVDRGIISYDFPVRMDRHTRDPAETLYVESGWPPKRWVGPSKQPG